MYNCRQIIKIKQHVKIIKYPISTSNYHIITITLKKRRNKIPDNIIKKIC